MSEERYANDSWAPIGITNILRHVWQLNIKNCTSLSAYANRKINVKSPWTFPTWYALSACVNGPTGFTHITGFEQSTLSPSAFRRNGEGYVFTDVCLFTGGGGTPGHWSMDSGPRSFPGRWGYRLISGPRSFPGGYPSQVLGQGTPSGQDQGRGTPLWTGPGQGYPRPPPPPRQDRPRTGYGVGSMPLAAAQENFLVVIVLMWDLSSWFADITGGEVFL